MNNEIAIMKVEMEWNLEFCFTRISSRSKITKSFQEFPEIRNSSF